MKNKFDYSGYSESKLLSLCSEKNSFTGYCEWKYWSSELYSFGKYARIYGFYPKWLPLYVYMEHGVDMLPTEYIAPHNIENDAYCMFFMDSRKIPFYKKQTNKPCYPMKSLSVFCRRYKKINKIKNSIGTLFFFSHSTPDIDNNMNIEKLCDDLKQLPESFQPVCVCLHMHDINKGCHKVFIDNNIPVYTAGNTSDCRFSERFYQLMKNFKYSASNEIGSYTFYSVEMQIPFFYYGSPPEYYNKLDDNIPKGPYNLYKTSGLYNNTVKMFTCLYDGNGIIISEEQKEAVRIKLGLDTGIPRLKMSSILWKAYFQNENVFDFIIRFIKYWHTVLLIFIAILKRGKKDFSPLE